MVIISFIYISPIFHNFPFNLEIGGISNVLWPNSNFKPVHLNSKLILSQHYQLLYQLQGLMCYNFFFFFFFSFFSHFAVLLEKVSLFNGSTFTNFDHNSEALNILYHEMSLLFHQYFTFCDQMPWTVKKM